jgi:hypothetical protein
MRCPSNLPSSHPTSHGEKHPDMIFIRASLSCSFVSGGMRTPRLPRSMTNAANTAHFMPNFFNQSKLTFRSSCATVAMVPPYTQASSTRPSSGERGKPGEPLRLRSCALPRSVAITRATGRCLIRRLRPEKGSQAGDGRGDISVDRARPCVDPEQDAPTDMRSARHTAAVPVEPDGWPPSRLRPPTPPSRYRAPTNAATSSCVFRFRYHGARPRS